MVSEYYYLRKNLKATISVTFCFFLGIIILFQSVFLINGSSFLKLNQAQEEVKTLVEYRADPDDEEFRILFLKDYWTKEMRLKSSDNNLNWRLQIWQDVYFSIYYRDLVLTGYGYSLEIPAMEIISRQGLDRLMKCPQLYCYNLCKRWINSFNFIWILFSD